MKKLIRAGAVAAASLLASNVAALEVGTPAPDFTANSTHGEIVLSQIVLEGPGHPGVLSRRFHPWLNQ